MTTQEIGVLLSQVKIVKPSFSKIETPKKEDYSNIDDYNRDYEEFKQNIGMYISLFGELNYGIAMKALKKITDDEKLLEKFNKTPAVTLANETKNLTDWIEQENTKRLEANEYVFFVDLDNKYMRACGKHNSAQRFYDHDRPMTPLEEDYWINNLMSEEEYKYHKNLLDYKPNNLIYNPRTREVKEEKNENI